uniref:Ubiquitin specific peptidase 40 n=1 Tax=Latimeria chalumnae TaxID=7897 RepID=H3B0S8_LATCH
MFGDLFEEEDDSPFVLNDKGLSGQRSGFKELVPPAPRGAAKLSGIANQGGTCYLNSLLQTLLFTPEFREALFSLGEEDLGCLADEENPDSRVRVIPLQLQRLFAQLLLVDQQAASTANLTDSFGWTSNEERSQHDVQELNRILFSALESSLVGTSGHDLINRLYHGAVVNKISCEECGNVSERQEDFLDLTVAVKDVSSLEEALWNMYVEEEYFDNENLYRCSACNKLVKAAKSAKLRKLPLFLTISLLRFNFDFVACQRYKEMGRYTFPLQINLQPFCEQGELADSEYLYELFSVIIHKGGCYGGHYHVYIKDLDQLGTWYPQDDMMKQVPSEKDAEDSVKLMEMEDPSLVLSVLIAQENVFLPILGLAQSPVASVTVRWNVHLRFFPGWQGKFLLNHPETFVLSSDRNWVSLKPSGTETWDPQPNQRSSAAADPASTQSCKTQGSANAKFTCSHWFDFNDSKVQPIQEKDIEKQFQGKESAYMLFYRQCQLQRPAQACGNPGYKVPLHLLYEAEVSNRELQKLREEYDFAVNNMALHLHVGIRYKIENGVLHPVSTQQESVVDLTLDRRKTVAELRQAVFQMLDFWEGDMTLSVAKMLPAGLHLCYTLKDEQQTLWSLGIPDGADIFVWNGREVSGAEVPAGSECEPVLLNILQPTEGADWRDELLFWTRQVVFPRNTVLGDVCSALADSTGIPAGSLLLCQSAEASSKTSRSWRAFLVEDMKKTVADFELRDGSSVLVLDCNNHDSRGGIPRENGAVSSQNSGCGQIQIRNFCGGRVSQAATASVNIRATGDMLVSAVKAKALEELHLEKELENSTCLRLMDRNGKLLPPVREDVSMKEAKLKLTSTLGLCPGTVPSATQLFLYFVVGSDLQASSEMEVIVEETVSVKQCLKIIQEKAGLTGDCWHLRRMDWCYEAGDALNEEEASLKSLKICSGDALVITEGQLPPEGFLKLPVWLYQSQSDSDNPEWLQDQLNHITDQMINLNTSQQNMQVPDLPGLELFYMGDVEISAEATLGDLKTQVMTLPALQHLCVPSVEFLRAWILENKRPSKILRNHRLQLSNFKLGSSTEIAIQLLQREENLGSDLQKRTYKGALGQGSRTQTPGVDNLWTKSLGGGGGGVGSSVKEKYLYSYIFKIVACSFKVKYTQKVSKKKKRRKLESLQGAPYHLKEGDLIGVKNLLLEDSLDFSTLADDVGIEKMKQQVDLKKKSLQSVHFQSDAAPSDSKPPARSRRPEVALSINVGVFR